MYQYIGMNTYISIYILHAIYYNCGGSAPPSPPPVQKHDQNHKKRPAPMTRSEPTTSQVIHKSNLNKREEDSFWDSCCVPPSARRSPP